MGKTIKTKEQNQVDGKELLSKLKEKVLNKYGSVYAFSESDIVKTWGYTAKAVATYLSNKEVMSFPFMKKLCEHFKMGELKKEFVITRKIIYSYEQDSKNNI